jgi:hypothetical protein
MVIIMTTMTRDDVAHIVGPAVDDRVILEIIATGASKVDLEKAIAWLNADDAMTRSAHHQPHGVVAEVCEILSRAEVEIERD